ncbi:hypothetical protein PIGHUM_04722 [Pigmentiphaga humi]|uniref:Lipoprotein n=1 Tax=Pigmentiphaga humi TaxID=2478468 RepID=A0A3P4BAG7_9BURK|nr:hypothetical protein [Pigmentiphaga humi]VCU72620.1 hypothetical protein PIGHUM_04722 [Pigmentiphaga humi]
MACPRILSQAAPRAALLLAAALALPACAHDAASTAPAGKARDAFVAQRGKPGSPVHVSIRVPAAPLAVGATRVGLALEAVPGVTEVGLSYRTEGALRVEAEAPARVVLDGQRKAVVEVPVTILANGVHYLHVYTDANGRQGAISIRLDASRPTSAKAKTSAPSTQSGGFILLPTQENRSGGSAR